MTNSIVGVSEINLKQINLRQNNRKVVRTKMQDFMNMKKTAELLNVHPVTVNRYCKQGILTYYQVGNRKRFLLTDIEKFIKGAVRHATTENSENPFDAS